jgi:hypothetical protein
VEARKAEARLEGRVGDDAIAKYSTGSGYAGASKVIGRKARRRDACPWRRKRAPGEMARSQRGISNSAAADARASDRMAGKSQTPTAASKARSTTSDVPAESPTAASKAHSTASDVPAEAPTAASKARSTASDVPAESPASAATTAGTGFRCVDDRGNREEQDRRGGNASYQASLGGGGRFEHRCARRRREGLIVFLQVGSAHR